MGKPGISVPKYAEGIPLQENTRGPLGTQPAGSEEHTHGKRYFTWDPKHFPLEEVDAMLDDLNRCSAQGEAEQAVTMIGLTNNQLLYRTFPA